MDTYVVASIQILAAGCAHTHISAPMRQDDARGALDGIAECYRARGETVARLSPDVLRVAPSAGVANGCTLVVSPLDAPAP